MFRKITVCVGVLSILFLFSSLAFAQSDDIITDRPDQTESAVTVQTNHLQVETGLYLEKMDETKNYGINTSLFRYGISNNLEIRLVTDVSTLDVNGNSTTSFGDLNVGFKYTILKGDIELGYIGHYVFPTGDEAAGYGEQAYSSTLALAHAITEDIAIGYNIGYDIDSESNDVWRYTVAVGTALAPKTGVFLELYGDADDFDEFNHNFDMGFTYLSHPNVQYDLSFGIGLNHSYSFISAGVSFRLPN